MDEELEQRLRRALQGPEPPSDLSERVLARVAAAQAPAVRRAPRPQAARRWIGWALAASLLAAALLPALWHHETQRAGLRARAQLIEALRVSSQKLDLAYRMVNPPPASGGEDVSGV
jgi:hypothetical protein